MAFTPVADPLLDSGKPARSTDVKQMRDNQADHETRISALEAAPDAYVKSHFTQNHFYSDNSAASLDGILLTQSGDGDAQLRDWPEPFYLFITHNGAAGVTSIINQVAVTGAQHYLRIDADATTSVGAIFKSAGVQSRQQFRFDTMTPPITFRARVKQGTADRHIGIGLIDRQRLGVTWSTQSGIYLERNGAGGTQWYFTSGNGGSFTNGTAFAEVAAGTWFEVEIIFTNDPSNQALCYIDGVLKQTLTTNLPTAQSLYASVVTYALATTSEVMTDLDIDYIECFADASQGDAA